MIASLRLTAAAAACAASLAAQLTVTFPSDHANVAGAFATQNYPYSNGVSRIMLLYEAWDVGVAPGASIGRIGVRQDGVQTAPGRSLQLEVRMGYTARTSANMLTNYDQNYAGPAQSVFGPALFALPAFVSTPPGGQIVWLDLTTPFVWQPSNGNLLIEWRVSANSTGGAAFNYPLDRADFLSPVTSGSSVGCQHSGGQTATLTSQPTRIGGNWNLAINQGPASSAVLLAVQLGGALGAPVSLQPVLPGIQPTCQIFVSGATAFFGATTGTTGYFQWVVPIPNNLAFNDLTIASQALFVDFFSPGGFVTSDGDQVQFGVAPAQTMLYSAGSVSAITGLLWTNFGLVTLFQ